MNGAGRSTSRTRRTHIEQSDDNSHRAKQAGEEDSFVLVPADEYEKLVIAQAALQAIEQIERGDNEFVDADDFALVLAGEWIAKARKTKGWTQKQLGKKLGIPQSQVSRIEKNPDRTTVRTLKKVAKALGVNLKGIIR